MGRPLRSTGIGGAAGVDTVDRPDAGGTPTSMLSAARVGDSSVRSDRSRGTVDCAPPAPFAVPAVVVLATLAVLEGYGWLHLIPGGPERPTTVPFVAGVLPATIWLTHRIDCPLVTTLGRVIRALAALVLALGAITLAVPGLLLLQSLGGLTLALAAALLALAVAAEVQTRRSGPY